jgi:hypothetical protein
MFYKVPLGKFWRFRREGSANVLIIINILITGKKATTIFIYFDGILWYTLTL